MPSVLATLAVQTAALGAGSDELEDQAARFEAYRSAQNGADTGNVDAIQRVAARHARLLETLRAAEETRVAAVWPDAELSSPKVWVEYSADLAERRRVDFEAGTIVLERRGEGAALGDAGALQAQVTALLLETREQAFARDPVAVAAERRALDRGDDFATAELDARPVLWPWLTGRDTVDPATVEAVTALMVARAEVETIDVGIERLQRATIPLDPETVLAQLERLQSGGYAAEMPEVAPQPIPIPDLSRVAPEPERSERVPERTAPDGRTTRPPESRARPDVTPRGRALPARARSFAAAVARHGESRGLDRALVFAIIETESAFNPFARSPVPAYGLMQIVPRSAGLDASQVLFGRSRLLSAKYLYDADRNVEIGAIYLDILWNRYLRGIENERSRLYCVIAAYNTGAGNVFRAFTGRTRPAAAFRAINRMSPDDVYRKLIWNLPYSETRRYLANVVRRMDTYRR